MLELAIAEVEIIQINFLHFIIFSYFFLTNVQNIGYH